MIGHRVCAAPSLAAWLGVQHAVAEGELFSGWSRIDGSMSRGAVTSVHICNVYVGSLAQGPAGMLHGCAFLCVGIVDSVVVGTMHVYF